VNESRRLLIKYESKHLEGGGEKSAHAMAKRHASSGWRRVAGTDASRRRHRANEKQVPSSYPRTSLGGYTQWGDKI